MLTSIGLIKAAPVNLAKIIIYYSLRKHPEFVKIVVDKTKSTNVMVIVLNLKSFPLSRYVTGKIISEVIYKSMRLIDQLGYHVSMFDEGDGMISFTESKFVKVVDDYDGHLILAVEKGRIKYQYLLK